MPDRPKRRSLTGQGADIFFNTATQEETVDSKTVEPLHSETALPSSTHDDQLVKTSFYPTQTQLDKLDDLATEYNKKYRRQRRKIDRQDIIRFLIEECTINTLADLET